jgi:hypothetical protein
VNKALILFLYGTTLYITVSRWYKAGNSGMPDPKVIGPASYLFGILALAADFLEGLPVVLALGLTFILLEKNPAAKVAAGTKTTSNPKTTKTASPSMSIGQATKNTKGVGT